jgi:hypothetical protein
MYQNPLYTGVLFIWTTTTASVNQSLLTSYNMYVAVHVKPWDTRLILGWSGNDIQHPTSSALTATQSSCNIQAFNTNTHRLTYIYIYNIYKMYIKSGNTFHNLLYKDYKWYHIHIPIILKKNSQNMFHITSKHKDAMWEPCVTRHLSTR